MMNHSIQQTRLACLLSYPNQLPAALSNDSEQKQCTKNTYDYQTVLFKTSSFFL